MVYMLAFVFIMHGLAHLSGFIDAWMPVEVFAAEPWIFSKEVTMKSAVGRLFGLLWLAAALALIAAGYGLVAGNEGWQATAIGGAALSLTVIIPWFRTVPLGAKFGIAFDLIIIVSLLFF